MKISKIIYQLWHFGVISSLVYGFNGTLKVGKDAMFYHLFTLSVFIAGLIYYYFQAARHKAFDFKTVIIVVFFEFIIFLLSMIKIFEISWQGGGSLG